MDDAKGTPEDPDAVRSRLVATLVHTYAREDVTQATPPINAFRIIVSQVATKTIAKGQHDCLIGGDDIRVAFSMRMEAGESLSSHHKELAPPSVGDV